MCAKGKSIYSKFTAWRTCIYVTKAAATTTVPTALNLCTFKNFVVCSNAIRIYCVNKFFL